jgi:hypothetical protein
MSMAERVDSPGADDEDSDRGSPRESSRKSLRDLLEDQRKENQKALPFVAVVRARLGDINDAKDDGFTLKEIHVLFKKNGWIDCSYQIFLRVVKAETANAEQARLSAEVHGRAGGPAMPPTSPAPAPISGVPGTAPTRVSPARPRGQS